MYNAIVLLSRPGSFCYILLIMESLCVMCMRRRVYEHERCMLVLDMAVRCRLIDKQQWHLYDN